MAIVFDQIGEQQFIRLDGDIDVKGETLVDITRPGADGSAYKKFGKRGKVTRLRGVADFASAAAADAAHDTYKAMIATLVTIKKNGINRVNYIVLDVRPERDPVVATAIGGLVGGNHMVRSEWDVQYAGV